MDLHGPSSELDSVRSGSLGELRCTVALDALRFLAILQVPSLVGPGTLNITAAAVNASYPEFSTRGRRAGT